MKIVCVQKHEEKHTFSELRTEQLYSLFGKFCSNVFCLPRLQTYLNGAVKQWGLLLIAGFISLEAEGFVCVAFSLLHGAGPSHAYLSGWLYKHKNNTLDCGALVSDP